MLACHSGGHVYRRIKVTRAPGYMIGSNADCFHSIDVGVGPTIIDSELGYCLDDFFNIHNTIHLLYPSPKPSPTLSAATLINPRISNCAPHSGFALNDTNEKTNTLDLWYGGECRTVAPLSLASHFQLTELTHRYACRHVTGQ